MTIEMCAERRKVTVKLECDHVVLGTLFGGRCRETLFYEIDKREHPRDRAQRAGWLFESGGRHLCPHCRRRQPGAVASKE